ncbi:hypothetical protein JQK15_25100 [Sphingobium sp. BHU LFT2]|uniref:sigma factor n=1 Tax=Sphingobium sp. BHU LFT2 TaxID=2807634 RepID=UPI001BE8729F|nr:hypothetical protein [Sphingobium sp. BHU LFT2]
MGHSKFQFDQLAGQRGNLVQYARKITGDRDNAEEVVQEAYVRFGEMATRQSPDNPGGYLELIAEIGLPHRRLLSSKLG